MSKREQYPPGTIQYTANYQVGGPVYSPPATQGPPSAKYAQFAAGAPPSSSGSSVAYPPPPSSAGSQYPYSPTTNTSYHSSMPYAPDSPMHSPSVAGSASRRDDYYHDDYERAYRDAERHRDDEDARVRDIERRERESEREYERRKEREREMERERVREREMDRDRINELERRERQSQIDWERQREMDRLNEIERRGQSAHLGVERDRRERVPSRTRERSRSKERGGLKLSVETGSSKTRLSVSKSKKEDKKKKKEQREAALAWSSGDSNGESDSGSAASSGRRSDDSRRRRHHRHRSPRQSTGSFHGGHSPRHSTSSFHSSHPSESGGRYLADDGYRRNPREHRPSFNSVTTKFDRMELMSPQSGRHSPPSPGGFRDRSPGGYRDRSPGGYRDRDRDRDRDRYYADLSPLPSPVMGPADSSRAFDFNVSGGFSIGRPAHGGSGDGSSGKWPSLTSGAPNFLKPSILKKTFEERYDPTDDAKALYKGLKGRSGDPTPIIKILPKLSGPQILKLKSEFKRTHPEGFSLTKCIKLQLPGSFKLSAWITAAGPWESEGFWSIFSNHKPSYRYQLLIEALIGRSNEDILKIKDSYRDSKNDNSLEKAIKKELAADKNTGERFKSMILQQLEAKRMEEWDTVYYDKVTRDVEHLHIALSKTPKADTQAVVDILIQRNNTHLRETMKLYKNVHDKDLARTIITKIPNLVGEALLFLLNGVLNKPARDAKQLEMSMKGLGTANELLIARLVRMHWDPEHLSRVKEAYAQKYKRELVERIQGDTSGDYQTFLVALAKSDERKSRKS